MVEKKKEMENERYSRKLTNGNGHKFNQINIYILCMCVCVSVWQSDKATLWAISYSNNMLCLFSFILFVCVCVFKAMKKLSNFTDVDLYIKISKSNQHNSQHSSQWFFSWRSLFVDWNSVFCFLNRIVIWNLWVFFSHSQKEQVSIINMTSTERGKLLFETRYCNVFFLLSVCTMKGKKRAHTKNGWHGSHESKTTR